VGRLFPKGMNLIDMTKSNQILQTREKINERSAKSQTLSYWGLATLI
jgi:hypothetical protein